MKLTEKSLESVRPLRSLLQSGPARWLQCPSFFNTPPGAVLQRLQVYTNQTHHHDMETASLKTEVC